MRKDAWAVNRIYFWDAICQKVSATLKEKGVSVHEAKPWTPVNDVYTSVGEQVRLERQKAGLTQAALAASTGSTQQMISMVEAGQSNLSLSTLQRIAEGMGKKIVIELK